MAPPFLSGKSVVIHFLWTVSSSTELGDSYFFLLLKDIERQSIYIRVSLAPSGRWTLQILSLVSLVYIVLVTKRTRLTQSRISCRLFLGS